MPNFDPIFISDSANPLLAPYRDLKDAQLRQEEFLGLRDVFIAESELTVRELLKSRCSVVSVLTTPEMLPRLTDAIDQRALRDRFPVLVAPRTLVESVAGFQFHRGVLACGARPPDVQLQSLLSHCTSITILEGIANHDNIGGIFRNVAALGGERPGVILGPACCDPFYRKSLRVSIGHVLTVPFVRVDDSHWKHALRELKAAGWTIIALTPDPVAMSLHEYAQTSPVRVALMLGAEGPGLSARAQSLADYRVRIPMRTGVDSLNVGVAGAVAMSHLVRVI